MITSQGLQPDLHTYTNLAMTCRTISDAYELLQSLDASGLRYGPLSSSTCGVWKD